MTLRAFVLNSGALGNPSLSEEFFRSDLARATTAPSRTTTRRSAMAPSTLESPEHWLQRAKEARDRDYVSVTKIVSAWVLALV